MRTTHKRLAKLSGRTSRDAWLRLQEIRHHPRFPDLLGHLEKKKGTVRGSDVAQAALHLLESPADGARNDGKTLGDVLYPDKTKAHPSEEDWARLVRSIAAGDASAFHELYARMQPPVYALASRIVPDQRTAEEVTIEVFREAWCRAASYDPAEETVVGWVMNQARAKAIERLRVPQLPAPQPWAEPDWEDVAPGISCRILSRDTDLQRVSMLVRLAPGGEYPPHRHAGTEELHLLEGELWIDDRKLHPGAYNRAEAGTTDSRVFSDTGCMCVLITSTADQLR